MNPGGGRGGHYSRLREVMEGVGRFVYRGGWAGRAWGAVPGRTTVSLIEHRLAILPSILPPILPPLLPPPGPGGVERSLRVAFASDLHLGPITPRELLDNAFALLAAARPDVLILGGDYVFLDATPAIADELERRVAAVPAPVKLAVLGNHDLWTRNDVIERALERAGARVLVNQAAFLPAPFDDVAVLGLDDPLTGQPDPEPALRQARGAALMLGIVHSPEGLPLLAGRGPRLLLCGHTHGGQVALPSGPIIVHGKHGRRYPSGLFNVGDMQLFVSRGLGSVDLPFRVFARPDVSVFTLVPAEV